MGVSQGSRSRGFVQGAMLAVALVLLASSGARAACVTRRCPDAQLVATARTLVGQRCNCDLVQNHKRYMRCVKEVVKSAVRAGSLPAACKKPVLKCEGPTTCGLADSVACCTMSKKGKLKARIVASAEKCRGTACPGVRSALDACTPEGQCSGVAATFRSVQKVFTGSCALPTCHSSFARQGGLVLESEEVSYNHLVNKPSEHEQAKGLGLLRVKPGDVENSFLIRKLRGLGPGDSMPQGTPALPESIISMIEDWVARGAHTTAEECPADGTGGTCDTTPIDPGNFVWEPEPPLPVPAADEGIQLYVPQRPVSAGTEWETCYAFRPNWPEITSHFGTGGGAPIIRQQEYRMHKGSHHLLLYQYYGDYPEAYPEGFFPCFAANCLNPGDCPPDSEKLIPIGGTQVAGTRYVVQYPEGVGLPVLSANAVLIANLHYTNPFQPAQPIYGEAWLNIFFAKQGQYKVLLDGIFAINYQDMFVEPYQTKTLSRIWGPRGLVTGQSVDAAVFQLFGHMHKRGELFQIDFVKGGACSASGKLCGRDDDCACRPYQANCEAGQTCNRAPDAEDVTIYHTTEWDHAPVTDFPKPYLLVNKDQGLRWTCEHTNGYPGDPTRPPKRCHEGCNSCGWTGGRCSDNATLCNAADVCSGDETCVADGSGLSPTGFRCKNESAQGNPWRSFCCQGSCIPNPDARMCWFTRGVELNYDTGPRTYAEGEPMPVVFGELADDDMCNMFGYFITQAAAARLP
jgi:hypothetical protein